MLVYRSTAHGRPTTQLKRELVRVLELAARAWDPELSREALLRAGELECGVADATTGLDPASRLLAALTDAIARSYVRREPFSSNTAELAAARLPETVQISEPEGYAYYRLEPRSYAACVERVRWDAPAVGVIGVRSIGTSLSAVVAASLERRGLSVQRTTVRPTGHPWSRALPVTPELQQWIARTSERGARYVIVDEGPGLSGSTFIAVARALETAGVSHSRIRLLCSHSPNPDSFTSEVARAAWKTYDVLVCDGAPVEGGCDLSAGSWRRRVFGPESESWPACWTQVERVKHSSADGEWLDKFEGLPPYCQPALARASLLAEAGFAPAVTYQRDGMVRSRWVAGRAAEFADLERGALARIADYLAVRAREFRVANADSRPLSEMVRVNIRESLGLELRLSISLPIECAVISDARMSPYEWRATEEGRYLKLDGHADGCGHLLPGPCDVCWDLAGAIVEWRMTEEQAVALVRAFEERSALRVRSRLEVYTLAYCAYRVGAMTMAALSADAGELPRLDRARAEYRARLDALAKRLRLTA